MIRERVCDVCGAKMRPKSYISEPDWVSIQRVLGDGSDVVTFGVWADVEDIKRNGDTLDHGHVDVCKRCEAALFREAAEKAEWQADMDAEGYLS